MAKRQTIQQWPKDRQYNNGQKTDNTTMAKRQTIQQWPKDRQYNNGQKTDNTTMAKRERTNNGQQNTTQKTKDGSIRTPQKPGANSGAPEV